MHVTKIITSIKAELILLSKKKKIERKKFIIDINITNFKHALKKTSFFTKNTK